MPQNYPMLNLQKLLFMIEELHKEDTKALKQFLLYLLLEQVGV